MPALGVQFPVVPLPDGSNQLPVADPPAALRVALRADVGYERLALAIPRIRGIRSHSIGRYGSRSPRS
jgi:hypothetical protein